MVKVIQEVKPTCFEQAVGNPKWDNAMDEEMAALDVNATWELVALLEDKKAIGCKWVYKMQTQCRWICEQIQNKIGCQMLCPNLWHKL